MCYLELQPLGAVSLLTAVQKSCCVVLNKSVSGDDIPAEKVLSKRTVTSYDTATNPTHVVLPAVIWRNDKYHFP